MGFEALRTGAIPVGAGPVGIRKREGRFPQGGEVPGLFPAGARAMYLPPEACLQAGAANNSAAATLAEI